MLATVACSHVRYVCVYVCASVRRSRNSVDVGMVAYSNVCMHVHVNAYENKIGMKTKLMCFPYHEDMGGSPSASSTHISYISMRI